MGARDEAEGRGEAEEGKGAQGRGPGAEGGGEAEVGKGALGQGPGPTGRRGTTEVFALVLPEPAPWLGALLAELQGVDLKIFAPWALPESLRSAMRVLPGRARGALLRRLAPRLEAAASVRGVPGWPLLDGAARLLAGDDAGRQMEARFALRRATDALAVLWLPAGITGVIAPSCAARRTFAAARARGLRTVLVQDLPLIRQMHEDLDRAALAHPGCRFLHRYRAGHAVLVRQESEWVQADQVWTRGHFAHEALAGRGVCRVPAGPVDPSGESPGDAMGSGVKVLAQGGAAVGQAEAGQAEAGRAKAGRTEAGRAQGSGAGGREGQADEAAVWPSRLLLAGLATARNGVMEALALLSALPHATLLVRTGEGTEPADLLRHPRVRAVTPLQRETLDGVDLVLAPAWCEAYPPEVRRAVAAGIPVIATRRAAGACVVDAEVLPGDGAGLLAAVTRLRAR